MKLFILFPFIGLLVAINPPSLPVNDESMKVTENKVSEVLSSQFRRLRNSRRLSMNFGGPKRQTIGLKEAKKHIYHECCYEFRYKGSTWSRGKICTAHEVWETKRGLKKADEHPVEEYMCALREDKQKACRGGIQHHLSEDDCDDCVGKDCGDGECEDLRRRNHKCVCRDGYEAKYCKKVPMSLIKMKNLTNAGSDAEGSKWKRAFLRQKKWAKNPGCLLGELPKSVWYRFSQPTIIGRFSFRNTREITRKRYDPVAFDFIGSTDCVNWKVIGKFDDVKWSWNEDEIKKYTLNEDQRTLMEDNFFSCYGMKVRKVRENRAPCIQDFKMWRLHASLSLIKLENLKNTGDKYWYRLSQPTIIKRFSFRNKREPKNRKMDPLDFDFIGSTDCVNWKVIEEFDNVYWRKSDQQKKYTIKEEKRKLMEDNSFSCYGIKVRKTRGNGVASIQDFKMWRQIKVEVDEPKNFQVRLVGRTRKLGRVEVYHEGEWCTVYKRYNIQTAAEVVCKQLNLGKLIDHEDTMNTGWSRNFPKKISGGKGPILVGFKCSGSEKNLGKCGDGVSYTSEISHYYDLVVKCSGIDCDSHWKAGNHNQDNPKTCQTYATKKYCEKGTYGSGWDKDWGFFSDFADSNGRTALVCPECGCR